MLFWQWLWTALWFGGLGIFTVLALVVTVRAGLDLAALLRTLQAERLQAERLADSGPVVQCRFPGETNSDRTQGNM
jgi:hypothetical protein